MKPSSHSDVAIVFDLGGVLIDWDPRHLYRRLFDDEAAMERFLAEVCSPAWNAQQDAGRPWSEAIDSLVQAHPEKRDLIVAYRARWPEMLRGVMDDSVTILADLRAAGRRLYALSNWSAETFPIALERFPFLGWFDGIVISGEVGIAKPDARSFGHLMERYELRPDATVFIDDSPINVDAASGLGMTGLLFTSAAELRRDLVRLGLLAGGSAD